MNRVWKVNKCDIDLYQNWIFGGSSGVNPVSASGMNSIIEWPAHADDGSPLAPFVDINSDGIYQPYLGEVPKIKGDQAIFFVYNDKRGLHTETGGAAIGIQVQGMLYGYSCSDNPVLYNTVFCNYTIINKGSFTLDSTFIGSWTDFDIGDPNDDFVGCDVGRSMYYAHNGVSSDAVYGSTPPYQAVMMLKGPYADANGIDDPSIYSFPGSNYSDGIVDNERLNMSHFGYYNNDATVTGNPANANQFYDYMSGNWSDGTPWQYSGTGHLSGGIPTDYIYPGASDPAGMGTSGIPQLPWTEESAGNLPADRRGFGTFGPFTFSSGAVQEIEFAYVFAQASSGGDSASYVLMNNYADSLRATIDLDMACGCDGITSVEDAEDDVADFSFYPNPATETITIKLSNMKTETDIVLMDLTGRIIRSIPINGIQATINISDLAQGMYLLRVESGNQQSVKKLIKR
jgi:hypothetical protein